ncbi:[SSU ribosomal protein S18P]-alanine acetyltransferase [Oryzisolibacter propanilivorax]|uniref:[Ribosomal protein bS18]-alanine N-acetyltransferase n=1 Tax=Oryzisolibacter propanilivorax TaxID=1527607 RepID=A0A1G9Q7L7_9BURK|nr:[SSU ribosomal protein S18P]-alanine acetyltransferase [Oryzisolibacter propanilivorax]
MSPAQPLAPQPDAPAVTHARFALLGMGLLDALMQVEQAAYAHPWSRGNFVDAMAAGYQCQLLLAEGDEVLGYFIAMRGVDEVHLLNLTVAPRHQRQGWAQVLLDALDLWARSQGAHWVWLEVRQSNQRARAIYERHGYRCVGERKHYYPAEDGQRETAIVMSLPL